MLFRAFAAATLLLVPAPVTADAYYVDIPVVFQALCGHSAGTAFIAGGKLVSVAHVTQGHNCQVKGVAIDSHEEANDFSTAGDVGIPGFRVNCGGFKRGEAYYAIGYAYGIPVQRLIPLVGTGEYAPNGEAALLGDPAVIPGMSGGPVINIHGEVVGTVNMYLVGAPVSLSLELRETSLCQH